MFPPSEKAGRVTPLVVTVPLIAGEVNVLLVKVSTPARVATVPVVGKVSVVSALVVRVMELEPKLIVLASAPDKVRELLTVNVLPALIVRVPVVLVIVNPS